MKGLATLSIFAFFYLVIIILFNGKVTNAEPRAADSADETILKPKNDTNPLADLFQVTDPAMRTAMGAVYGAYKGNDQCSRKAFCMMGNYMKDMPGRDLIFFMMGNYIPTEYSLYYEIFKAAVIYGQNCTVYVCVPDPENVDAATAARPHQKPTNDFNTLPRQL